MSQKKSLAAFGEQKVVEVLTACRGNIQQTAVRLGVNRRTIHRWMEKSPKLRALRDGLREKIVDKAEENVFAALDRDDLRVSMFILRTLGKNRGYTERREVAPPHATPDKMPTSQLLSMLQEARGQGALDQAEFSEEDRSILQELNS